MTYIKPIKIADIVLENNLALAPMAGTTDLVYRSICREMGAGLTVTELVSARGMVYDPDLRKTYRYIEISPEEYPVAIQLFGSEPEDFDKAVRIVLNHPILSSCAMIDINMGCPVAKVVKQGAGSALMLDPTRAGKIAEICVKTASEFGKPVTAKIRTGWDEHKVNGVEVAKVLESVGIAAITVHGRTRKQMYSGQADWEIITRIKQEVGIIVYGNGDVTSPESAKKMIDMTGVDGVMIGRAAQGNPWLFAGFFPEKAETLGLNADNNYMPAKVDRVRLILRHLDGLISRLGESTAVREMRPQMSAYLKNSRDAARFRQLLMRADSRVEVATILGEWCID
jgi:nifR3 family TIM-barrel protein